MKANEAPEKIYIDEDESWHLTNPNGDSTEYIRTNAFIEKACEFWKDHMAGYDICEDDIERSIESFKLAMIL